MSILTAPFRLLWAAFASRLETDVNRITDYWACMGDERDE